MGQVKFKEWLCTVEKANYGNGRTALVLRDAEDGGQVAVATVNLPGVSVGADEVFIKDYSENEGMLAALIEAGVVEATGANASHGSAEVVRARLRPPYRGQDPIESIPKRDANGGVRLEKGNGRTR